MRRGAKRAARLLLHGAGGLRAIRGWTRRRFRILMYHAFPGPAPALRAALAAQCAHIRRHYTVVRLTDIGRALRDGEGLPPRALAVTVDDGRRDLLLNGHPVFREYGIPVLAYLTSGFLDGELRLWWDTEADPLRWAEVRRLQEEGVEFGAHTMTHPRLSRVADARRLEAELAGSKRRVEEETGRPVLHFAYPFGLPADVDEASVRTAARCGFLTAALASSGLGGPGADSLRLPRLPVEPGMSLEYFKELLAGLHL